MDGNSQFSDTRMHLETLWPTFHLPIAAIFVATILILGFLSLRKQGVYRAY